ncbi:MAG: phosphoenolpyruvate carboxykinase (ATP) [Candidatus Atribacteria bacterium]|nr:phosphoenolpyruvate carboxykinase (ATP) [Candidatus Atribacteria bacterium]
MINKLILQKNKKCICVNLSIPELVEKIVINSEGFLSDTGSVLVKTGEFTGRSPDDKYIVDYGTKYDQEIDWGKTNQKISPERFDTLLSKVLEYLERKKLYVQDVQAGADKMHQRNIRIFSEFAWSALFCQNLFINSSESNEAEPDFLVIQAPGFKANPLTDGVKSPTFVIIDFEKKIILIGNTQYAGEIKKSVFTVMNRLLPADKVLPMHCSANIGKNGDTALFFGLSGTGKTTLSSDPERSLIGDDEHGWSAEGIFNFEGGCYAKTINLHQKDEPLIWDAVHSFGSILENVVFDSRTRKIDFTDGSITENTRGAYDLSRISNYVPSGKGNHPGNIFFLCADAFGVLPPISLLSGQQILDYFLAGYTAKLAGTERGLGTEPVATFSSCFGAPFLPLPPMVYAKMLLEKIEEHQSRVWLVNTGWVGGEFGIGERIKLPYTRAMISAALNGQISISDTNEIPIFNLKVPKKIPGIPNEILNQRLIWNNPQDYDRKAMNLQDKFTQTLEKFK